jgi:hypothetical protein
MENTDEMLITRPPSRSRLDAVLRETSPQRVELTALRGEERVVVHLAPAAP